MNSAFNVVLDSKDEIVTEVYYSDNDKNDGVTVIFMTLISLSKMCLTLKISSTTHHSKCLQTIVRLPYVKVIKEEYYLSKTKIIRKRF